jgi:hypothetical protein
MKQMKMIGMAILLSFATQAGWKPLKKVEEYTGTAYNLKSHVAYMEIRLYKTKKSTRANKVFALYRKPLSSYAKSMVSKFKNLEKRYSDKESYLRIRNHGNAFFIDTHGKMFWTDEIKDIKMLLGEIDTPAELSLVLWLGYENGWQTYKKTSHGYKIKRTTRISACMDDSVVGTVDRQGNYRMGKDIRHLTRQKCKKRKHTAYIMHPKIDYESYNSIDIDGDENLYVVGDVLRNKTYHSSSYNVLDKYSSSGKLLWSRKIAGFFNVKVAHNAVYLIENNKIKAKYSTDGKKLSFGKGETVAKAQQSKSTKYTPRVLSGEKKHTVIIIADHKISKKGNVYVVGMEIFYPSGVPTGTEMCGNNGQVEGAVIAKFNTQRKMLWAKILDRDD